MALMREKMAMVKAEVVQREEEQAVDKANLASLSDKVIEAQTKGVG